MAIGSIVIVSVIGFEVTTNLTPPPVPLYLEPAGYAFSIWSIIYLSFIGFGVYQFSPARREDPRFQKARVAAIVNAFANTGWLIAAMTDQRWLTVVLILLVLYTLAQMAIAVELGRPGADLGEKLLVKLPIGLYFGWITLASPVNITSWLVSDLGWTGESLLNPMLWTAIITVVATGIFVALYLYKKVNAVFLGVGVWGLVAIWAANIARSSLVANTALAMAVVLAGLLLYTQLARKDFAFL